MVLGCELITRLECCMPALPASVLVSMLVCMRLSTGVYGRLSGPIWGRFGGMAATVVGMSDQTGPVLPMYLNADETRILAVSVGVMIQLDSAVLVDQEAQGMAHEAILERYGMPGVARADQALAAARERLPILRSLRTALEEHGASLERMSDEQ
jgi:hypothetical protein